MVNFFPTEMFCGSNSGLTSESVVVFHGGQSLCKVGGAFPLPCEWTLRLQVSSRCRCGFAVIFGSFDRARYCLYAVQNRHSQI